MKSFVCIMCPEGCQLTVDPEQGYTVTGNRCARGTVYGVQEARDPQRTVTSTVKVVGGTLERVPVKTSTTVPKHTMLAVMEKINAMVLQAPVASGQVLIEALPETTAVVVATRAVPVVKGA